MKKLIYITLLLIPYFSIGQTTTGQEQSFNKGIRNKSSQVMTDPINLATQGTDGTQGIVTATTYKDILKYATAFDFPVTGVVGKFYYAIDNDNYFTWSGATYEVSGGIDESDLVHISRVETITGTKTFDSGEIKLNGQISNTVGKLFKQNESFVFEDGGGNFAADFQNGSLGVYGAGNIYGKLNTNLLTGNRDYSLPDDNGELALKTDITPSDLQSVLDTGRVAVSLDGESSVTLMDTNGNGDSSVNFILANVIDPSKRSLADFSAEEIRLSTESPTGQVTISTFNEKLVLTEANQTANTTLQFENATANTVIKVPAKPAGTYTLATTDDLGSGGITGIGAGTNVTIDNTNPAVPIINVASSNSPITVVNSNSLFSTGLSGTGSGAVNVTRSIFLGESAGAFASNVTFSNMFGVSAGYGASFVTNSNFFGTNAGLNAINSSYSNFIGYRAGESFSGNNIGTNNIVIGTNISLPNTVTNSLNIGGVLFGTGTYATTNGNPLITPSTIGKIGIGVVTPSTKLHVYSDTADTSGLRLERLTSSSPTSTGQAIGVDSNGNVIAVASVGTTETASNGLTKIGNDIQLGGLLTNNTTITGNYQFGISNTLNSGTSLIVNNLGSSSTAILGQGIFRGVYGESDTGYGIYGFSNGGIGGYFDSNTDYGLISRTNSALNNTVIPSLSVRRGTFGTALNGIGTSLDFQVEVDNFTEKLSNTIISKWTNATVATRTSEFSIEGLNNAVTNTLITLSGNGSTKLNKYGLGAFTGTPAYNLQVDANGNLIESAVSGGGSVSDATTTTKGIVKLAGDLGGTADLPTVPGLSLKYDASNPSGYQTYPNVVDVIADFIVDSSYDATTWNAVTDDAPSLNSVRDKFVLVDLEKANVTDVVDLTSNQTIEGNKEFINSVQVQGNVNLTGNKGFFVANNTDNTLQTGLDFLGQPYILFGQPTAGAEIRATNVSDYRLLELPDTSGTLATQDEVNSVVVNSELTDLSDVTISTPSSGQILEYNGTVWTNTEKLIPSGQIIVTSGTSFTTPPTGVNLNTIYNCELVGGGGAGGYGVASNGSGSGGGAGGYVFKRITGLNPNTTYVCSIGIGGNSTTGNATSTTLTIDGVTYTAGGGLEGADAANSDGGVGGSGSGGDINIKGQDGQDCGAAASTIPSGTGGSSPKGWGLGGQSVFNNKQGSNATGYGGGGSSGKNTNQPPGNGTGGVIFCQWYNQ